MANKAYSKTKTELLQIVNTMIDKYGEEYKIECLSIEQADGLKLLTVPLSVQATHLLFQRLPRDYDNPDGIQRALKDSKISSIRTLAKDRPRYTSPNAAVANILVDKRNWGVQLVQDHGGSGKMSWLIFNLAEVKRRINEAELDGEFIKNEEEVMFGYMIDAHHRTEGIYQAQKMDFELPVTLYVNLPREEMADVFVNINEYQEKPSTTHTLAMRAMSNSLSDVEQQANEIMNLLNDEEMFVLHMRIKTIDGPVPKGSPKTYLNGSTFHSLLVKFMLWVFPPNMNPMNKAHIINSYFEAWKEVFPEAWNDPVKHVLVKSMGFQVMMRLFDKIITVASVRVGGFAITKQQFVELIRGAYENETLTVGDKDKVALPLKWESEHFGAYSNGKGVNLLTDAMKSLFISKMQHS